MLVTFSLLVSFNTYAQQPSASGVTQYVNTFVGTTPLTDPAIVGFVTPSDWRPWSGLTYPGSALPTAMVQLSPVTAWSSGAGYQYEDDSILAFTHTNKGHWNLCNIPVLPFSGKASLADQFASGYSHQHESSSPGYYQVRLNSYGIDVKLTSTLRCGYHQYTFSNQQEKNIVFKLGKANNRVRAWEITQVDDHTIEGFQDVGNDKIFFYAIVSGKIGRLEKTANDEEQRELNRNNSRQHKDGQAILHLVQDKGNVVTLRIGLSFVSTANAKANLGSEIGTKSFMQVKDAANTTWESLLSRIRIEGGTSKQRMLFYSSLYRALLWPALRSDGNGEFTDVKGQTAKAGYNYYELPSLWDTYRNQVVLLAMMEPKLTADIISSMKDRGDKTGFIPTFFHGDHGLSFIAGSYLRGINDFDVKGTYAIMLRNAFVEGPSRPHLNEYMEKGYVPEPDLPNPVVETVAAAGVSKTLEYAYDDYALAQMAKQLGDSANYNKLMLRSKNYQHVFDPSSRFMRGRLANGDWVTNFKPDYPYYEYMYREANAWQLSFFAPQDMPGLVNIYGGAGNFEAKLDSLFTYPWNPAHIARNVETMIGQYCHGNQPDHEAPFAYYFINKPEKSQKMIDFILNERYGMGAQGLDLAGMDDAGEMSAWYVMSSLGLYSFVAADPAYLVTVPQFTRVTWTNPDGKVLTLKKTGNSRDLEAILVDGKPISGYFVPHSLFMSGGEIEIHTR